MRNQKRMVTMVKRRKSWFQRDHSLMEMIRCMWLMQNPLEMLDASWT